MVAEGTEQSEAEAGIRAGRSVPPRTVYLLAGAPLVVVEESARWVVPAPQIRMVRPPMVPVERMQMGE